jgi:hypothetical protein
MRKARPVAVVEKLIVTLLKIAGTKPTEAHFGVVALRNGLIQLDCVPLQMIPQQYSPISNPDHLAIVRITGVPSDYFEELIAQIASMHGFIAVAIRVVPPRGADGISKLTNTYPTSKCGIETFLELDHRATYEMAAGLRAKRQK